MSASIRWDPTSTERPNRCDICGDRPATGRAATETAAVEACDDPQCRRLGEASLEVLELELE